MSPGRELLTRAFALMDRALELPEDQRAAFVTAECASDNELLATTLSLLGADQRAGDFLEQPAGEHAAALILASTEDAMLGRSFGPFRTTRHIGSGGMGVVYLGERADGEFEQRVAIKCLRVIATDAELEARFRDERQILAGLQHPGIAHLLDGGISEEGVPWFAMEHVDGEPITQFCDHHRMGVRARIRLFLEVCPAVSYAHGQLVIHRDLKPSNIFVTGDSDADPATARVKLLDFGIARLLAPEGGTTGEDTLAAAYARRVTPGYAAPEQLAGKAVTTATDVYALGLLLYELLTGKRAHDVAELGAAEAAERIATQTPALPSAAAAVVGEELARLRGRTPQALGRALRGDLDAIIMQALEKQPEQRYRSVESLANDLLRHLGMEPVRARGAGRTYRLGRFLSRYRWAVGGGTAIVVLLATLSVVMMQSNLRIREALETARIEEARARETADFLHSMFEVLDPDTLSGETLTVEELLRRGVERVTVDLTGQPETLSPLLFELARIHDVAGLYSQADELLGSDLAILRELHGEAHPEIARRLHLRSIVADALGEYERAEALAEEALAMRLALLDSSHPDVGESMDWLGSTLAWGGQRERALRLSREAVEILENSVGRGDERTQTARHTLAWMLGYFGQYDEALPLYEQVIEADMARLGADHTEVLNTLSNFAVMLRHMDRLEQAETVSRRVLEGRLRVLGPEHAHVAVSQNNLAKLLHDKGAYGEAAELYGRAFAIFRKLHGERHNTVAITLANLAQSQYLLGRTAEAERHFRQSLDIHREVTPATSAKLAGVLSGLGRLLSESGRTGEAEGLLREALDVNLQALGEEHWQVAETRLRLGQLLARKGEPDSARALLSDAAEQLHEHFDDAHPLVVEADAALARFAQ